MLKASIDKITYLTLVRACWRLADGDRRRMVGVYSLLFVANAINLLQPLIWGKVVNVVASGGGGHDPRLMPQLTLWIGAMVLALMGFWLFHGPARVIERRFAFQLRRKLTQRLYGHVTDLPWKWHQTHHTGDTLNRINYGVEAIYLFADEQFGYLDVFFSLVGSIAVLAWIAPWVGLMVVLAVPVLLLGMAAFDRRLSRLSERQNKAEHHLAAGLFDYLGNIGTVLTLRLQKASRSEVERRIDAISAPRDRLVLVTEQKWFFIQMFLQVILGAALLVYAAIHYGTARGLEVGSFVTIFRYLQQISGGVGGFGGRYQSLLRYRINLQGLEEIEAAYRTHAVPANDSGNPQWQVARASDVCFSYAGGVSEEPRTQSLDNVTIELARGRRIALVGASGSGKSTLLRLMCGLHEAESGTLSFDGVGVGGLTGLTSLSTLVPQEAEIFENTLRYNITCGVEDEATLAAVTHMACLDSVLPRLEQGVDTLVNERGANLSGGQKQRVALARGIFAARDSSLLLMDEPTSALDPGTEALVYDRIFAGRPDACVVSSVHRLHLLERFDYVYVMEAGRIVEEGTFDGLIQKNGTLARLWAAQAHDQPAPALKVIAR